ncbi:microsomal epoxide hydrolase [[Emmonsia] crescens]|uniref:Microsomal epoxide hydrolase n=1 Tax=[Emmonsia] crescens TaxID=73230 RepID=A0A2B7Z1D2_9EURO|nr:microsomal epoxide hydrolase [Emmonsia crescens]
MASSYNTIPPTASKVPEPFQVAIPEQQLSEFKALLKLSKIPAPTYESLQEDGRYGISHKWLMETKKYWEEQFDWRKNEEYINSFPNFKATVKIPAEDEEFKVHFVALFSQKADAIPIALFHGWPGSFLEFLPLLTLMKEKYTPQTLPYHLIVPSLPGYAFSSAAPLTRDFTQADTTKIMHQLMVDLGFETSGYLAQGGDLGSFVARGLAEEYEACKGFHLNFYITPTFSSPPKGIPDTPLTESEKVGIQRGELWRKTGAAYSIEHGTRPSTIGLLLGASPLALLGWIGEKFLSWSDVPPSTEEILRSVTLYWFTESMGRGIYPYRSLNLLLDTKTLKKSIGYSYFPKEICPTPVAWARKLGDMVFHKEHDKGGHFAALEQPQLFMEDLEAFVAAAWK